MVFHLGAQSTVAGAQLDPQYCFDTNVVGTVNLLDAAHDCSVKRVIYTSSREVYGDPLYLPVDESHPLGCKNLYGASKAAAEMYCGVYRESFGLNVLVLRLANVMGKGDRGRVIPIWIDNALQNHDVIVYGSNTIVDFVAVDIVVDALQQSMFLPLDGNPINIGSGVATDILDLARLIIEITGSSSLLKIVDGRRFEASKFCSNTTRMARVFSTRKNLPLVDELRQLIGAGPSPGVG